MGFSIVVGRNRHYSCSIWVPVSVSSIPLNGSLYTITDQYSAEYLRGAHHISPECSVYTALSCLALCSANSLPWSPLTLSSISSTKIVCWALPWFLLPELCPGNGLKAVSWDSRRTHLFPVSDIAGLQLCLLSRVLRAIVSYILSVFFRLF